MTWDITEDMQLNRSQHMLGPVTFPDGHSYYFGSGSPTDPNHPSIPLGSSRFNVIQPAPTLPGKEGFMLYGSANGYDPLVQRVRKSIMIHKGRTDDTRLLRSWGCLSIQASSWEDFKLDVEKYVDVYGDVYLNVHPDETITITIQPIYNEQGEVI